MRLIGGLRQHGGDWDVPQLASLFKRLGAIIEGPGVTRYVGYHGQVGGVTTVRFFGVQVDSIESIPRGMVALQLDQDAITVLRPSRTGTSVARSGPLTWDWLDRSVKGAPVGEFTAQWPARRSPVEFVLSTNAHFERGRSADDDVRLVDYDPGWPAQFEKMASRLRRTIPAGIALRVERYGSTAIPGMPAKPVIDILVEVPSWAEARRSLIPIFNRPDCEYWWYGDHMMFIVRREPMGVRTHHIHVAPSGHRIWEGIAFRDYLRAHSEEATRYAALKRALAESTSTEREAYTDRKADFVREIVAKARRPAR